MCGNSRRGKNTAIGKNNLLQLISQVPVSDDQGVTTIDTDYKVVACSCVGQVTRRDTLPKMKLINSGHIINDIITISQAEEIYIITCSPLKRITAQTAIQFVITLTRSNNVITSQSVYTVGDVASRQNIIFIIPIDIKSTADKICIGNFHASGKNKGTNPLISVNVVLIKI